MSILDETGGVQGGMVVDEESVFESLVLNHQKSHIFLTQNDIFL